jgi:hypothetical protein
MLLLLADEVQYLHSVMSGALAGMPVEIMVISVTTSVDGD